MQTITQPQTPSNVGEGSIKFTKSQTELGIYKRLMFVYTFWQTS